MHVADESAKFQASICNSTKKSTSGFEQVEQEHEDQLDQQADQAVVSAFE